MYITLDTFNVWEISGKFDARNLIKAIPLICENRDLLVLGSYRASEVVIRVLVENEVLLPNKRPFTDWFDLNRDEYPVGRFYAVNVTQILMDQLGDMCLLADGGIDKSLFFDHIIAYRPSKPIVPLLNFHDAFTGGLIYISGHYSKDEVQVFCAAFCASFRLIENPENEATNS